MIRLSLIPVAAIIATIAATTLAAQEIPALQPDVTRVASPILAATQSTVRTWITNQSAAATKAEAEPSTLDASLRTSIPTRFAGQKLTAVATDALVLLVLVQSAEAMSAEIKLLLAQIDQTRSQREALREFIAKLKASGDTTGLDAAEERLDSLDELSKQQSLRLQQLLERLERYHSALSAILKKIASAQSTILQNLK